MTTRKRRPRMIDWDWKKIPIPAGVIVAVLAAAYVGFGYAEERYLKVVEFVQYTLQNRQQLLRKDQRDLSIEVKVLETKRAIAPAQFTPLDKVQLDGKAKNLEAVEKELFEVDVKLREKK